jgi:hypothetical protein
MMVMAVNRGRLPGRPPDPRSQSGQKLLSAQCPPELQKVLRQGGTLDVQSAAQPAAGAQNTCSTSALMLTATQSVLPHPQQLVPDRM